MRIGKMQLGGWFWTWVFGVLAVGLAVWGCWWAEADEGLLEALYLWMTGGETVGGIAGRVVGWVWDWVGLKAAAVVAVAWGGVERGFWLGVAAVVGYFWAKWIRSFCGLGWVFPAAVALWMLWEDIPRILDMDIFRKRDKEIELLRGLEQLEEVARGMGGGVWRVAAVERWRAVVMGRERVREDLVERALGAVRVVGDGYSWRRELREGGVRAVIFAGRREEYRPALEVVREMRGWRLVYANARGFVYGYVGEGWRGGVGGSDEGRGALWVAMRAKQLANAGEEGMALREFLRARGMAGRDWRVRVEYASFQAMRGRWREALEEVQGVLGERRWDLAALQVGVQAALALGKRELAWDWAERLRGLAPWDAFSLYLHARASNAVGAPWAEEESLRRLIWIFQRRGQGVGFYRVFLGQALAEQGLVEHAIREYETALRSGELTEEQMRQVEEAIMKLKEEK